MSIVNAALSIREERVAMSVSPHYPPLPVYPEIVRGFTSWRLERECVPLCKSSTVRMRLFLGLTHWQFRAEATFKIYIFELLIYRRFFRLKGISLTTITYSVKNVYTSIS